MGQIEGNISKNMIIKFMKIKLKQDEKVINRIH